MTKPHSMSVTAVPCRCDTVPDSIARNTRSFSYDEEMHEYSLLSPTGERGLILYHCPFCGGVLSRSIRGQKFHTVASAEEERLRKRCEGIATIADALIALGTPDYDDPRGSGSGSIDKVTGQSTSTWFRTIWYRNLSETADVTFTETEHGTAFVSIIGKHKG